MMNIWHQFLSSYFGFNKQQRNGLFVLLALILSVFIIRLSLSHFIKPEPTIIADFSDIKFSDHQKMSMTKDSLTGQVTSPEQNLFVFDPNTVTKDQLIKLGFKEKT